MRRQGMCRHNAPSGNVSSDHNASICVVTARRPGVMRRQGQCVRECVVTMRCQGLSGGSALSGGNASAGNVSSQCIVRGPGSSPICRRNASSTSAPRVIPKLRAPCVYFLTFRFFELKTKPFQLYDVSTFRLFEIENGTVPHFSTFGLLDFSTLTMKPFHFSTFYFSNFPVTCSTLVFLSQTVLCPYNGRTLAPIKTQPAKKHSQKVKTCLQANTCYA